MELKGAGRETKLKRCPQAIDQVNYDQADGNQNKSFLVFSLDNKLLVDHPVTRGREKSERIARIVTFTGQSLKGPEGSVAFLKLSDTAMDRQPPARDAKPVTLDRLPNGQQLPPGVVVQGRPAVPAVSAAGRAQATAFQFGKGRVVVLGENWPSTSCTGFRDC